MKKTHIIIHHSAVSREDNAHQFDAINNYHAGKGWGMIGYHWLIEPNGKLKKGREESAVGAHCKEWLMNWLSIGICLTGNFDIEKPTLEQIETLENLIKGIQMQYKIKDKNIKPHKAYAKYKSCPGDKFPSKDSQDILGHIQRRLESRDVSKWAKESVQKAIDSGIATEWTYPKAQITNEEVEIILHRLGVRSKLRGSISKEEFIVAMDNAKLFKS